MIKEKEIKVKLFFSIIYEIKLTNLILAIEYILILNLKVNVIYYLFLKMYELVCVIPILIIK